MDREAGGNGIVIARVVGGEESSRKPVGTDLIGHLAAEVVVGADTGLGREHWIIEGNL